MPPIAAWVTKPWSAPPAAAARVADFAGQVPYAPRRNGASRVWAASDIEALRQSAAYPSYPLDALAATDDDKSRAARLLGIGDRMLWTKLKKHGF
jgi:DNA-binding NtrC family response regulator